MADKRASPKSIRGLRIRGRPTKYDPDYCEAVIEHAAKTGKSLLAFAGSLRVSRTTLNDWAKEHPEFREAMEIAKAVRADHIESICNDITNAAQMNYRLLALKNCSNEDWRDAKDVHVGGQQAPDARPLQIGVEGKSVTELVALLISAYARADQGRL